VEISVRVEPDGAPAPREVEYRWDADTDILCASLRAPAAGRAQTPQAPHAPQAVREATSVEVEGRDGSWLVLDVAAGGIESVEVAVWPDVRKRDGLRPPAQVEDARVTIPRRGGDPGAPLEAYEVTTRLAAESDDAERTIHFILGPPRSTRAVRIARDILLDVDARDRLAGLWLLNVPPCPDPT
jgi:hypothetical protein